MTFDTECVPTVFIVDDDDAVRDSLTTLISSLGFQVESYSSGSEFLKSCNHTSPGCIILDVRMPGMSGVDLQDQLIATGDLRPIIFITGHGDVQMSAKALENGAIEFLEKPYSPQKLISTINTAFELAKSRFKEQQSDSRG